METALSKEVGNNLSRPTGPRARPCGAAGYRARPVDACMWRRAGLEKINPRYVGD